MTLGDEIKQKHQLMWWPSVKSVRLLEGVTDSSPSWCGFKPESAHLPAIGGPVAPWQQVGPTRSDRVLFPTGAPVCQV